MECELPSKSKSEEHDPAADISSESKEKCEQSDEISTFLKPLKWLPVKSITFASLVMMIGNMTYAIIMDRPEMPKVNMNTWWGPLPMYPKQDLSIRPFEIEFSDIVVNDLRERLLHRRPFVPPLEDVGFQYGFNSNYLSRVLDFWQNKYDFKEREKFLNKFNHFKTNIQGLDIHFVHVKPEPVDGIVILPLLLLHGWPGSVREFYDIIPKLTTPRPGYRFVFEVIAPSLPGFGFSQAPVRTGLDPLEISVILNNLMSRIGHHKFYVQGGDYGHIIGSNMATLFPEQVLGFHTNMPLLIRHNAVLATTFLGTILPLAVVEIELQDRMFPWFDKLRQTLQETGYLHIQATKPDTVGIALTDSPAGLAAYILEKFSTWTNPGFKRLTDGGLQNKYFISHLLDNVMIYWSTNSITTSMRLYAETFNAKYLDYRLDQITTDVPTWGIKFKHELGFQPDSVLKYKYQNYLHSTIVKDGGHFAAFEMPTLLANDIFEAVKTFREFNAKTKRDETKQQIETIYDFTVKDIHGNEVQLNRYKGHVTIIVNVASQCGLTSTNYQQLNELYEKYAQSKGLRILAFPCNQFNSQEPGSAKDIMTFTREKGVKFDLFEKVEVNGENAHPLWVFLKRTKSGTLGDFIKWNFSKFIIDKNGVPVERVGPNVNPLDLEPILAKYW